MDLSKINIDTLRTIALNLPFKDIMRLCTVNKNMYKALCHPSQKNDLFWKKYYKKTFNAIYYSPLEELKRYYNREKNQNAALLDFIRSNCNYDKYNYRFQSKIYETIKKLFNNIADDHFGGVPPSRQETTITEEEIDDNLGNSFVNLYIYIKINYGEKDSTDIAIYTIHEGKYSIFDYDGIEQNLMEGEINDILDVFNSLYGTEYVFDLE